MNEEERIGKIVDSLDLGFSDFFKNENVRQFTLEKKLEMIEQAEALKTIEEAVQYSVFVQIEGDNPPAEIYILDFPSDFRASIYLLLGGYYRQSILCLRNWLEIRLTGVYFGFINPSSTEYSEWMEGKKARANRKGAN